MKTNRAIYTAIGLVVMITALIILMAAIKADRDSEIFLAETDQFIAKYETKAETETKKWVKVEAADEKDTKGSRTNSDRNDSRNTDSGTARSTEKISEDPTKVLSTEELAAEVIDGKYGNGDERVALLGDRYEEIQNYIDQNYIYSGQAAGNSYYHDQAAGDYYIPSGEGVLNPEDGINYYYGTLETYYNMDMSGVIEWMHSLGYDYEYWIREDGVKMFGPYVMVAADYGWLPKGSVTECSLGMAMVCDTGEGGYNWMDIAVTW